VRAQFHHLVTSLFPSPLANQPESKGLVGSSNFLLLFFIRLFYFIYLLFMYPSHVVTYVFCVTKLILFLLQLDSSVKFETWAVAR